MRLTRTPHRHVNVISLDRDRRLELLERLRGDARYTLGSRSTRLDARNTVLVLDVAEGGDVALEIIARLTARDGAPRVLAVVADETDLDVTSALVLAGAAGITSLHQPADGICQAAVDVADGLAALSPALEAALVRHLQAQQAA